MPLVAMQIRLTKMIINLYGLIEEMLLEIEQDSNAILLQAKEQIGNLFWKEASPHECGPVRIMIVTFQT